MPHTSEQTATPNAPSTDAAAPSAAAGPSDASRARPGLPAPQLMTVEEAAAYLNVSPHWLAEAVRQRRIRCTRLGRLVRFRLAHLEEFIAANEQPLTTAPGPGRALRPVPAPRRGGARSRL